VEKKLHIETNYTALFLGGLISSKTIIEFQKICQSNNVESQ